MATTKSFIVSWVAIDVSNPPFTDVPSENIRLVHTREKKNRISIDFDSLPFVTLNLSLVLFLVENTKMEKIFYNSILNTLTVF